MAIEMYKNPPQLQSQRKPIDRPQAGIITSPWLPGATRHAWRWTRTVFFAIYKLRNYHLNVETEELSPIQCGITTSMPNRGITTQTRGWELSPQCPNRGIITDSWNYHPDSRLGIITSIPSHQPDFTKRPIIVRKTRYKTTRKIDNSVAGCVNRKRLLQAYVFM